MSYDLFTRTTTRNHYSVVQEMFLGLYDNGYIFPRKTLGAVSPSTGRTLPDRYIEGTCPICGYDGARGDQCDNCGNQLDPRRPDQPALEDQRRDAGLRGDRAVLPRSARLRRRAGQLAAEQERPVAPQRAQVLPEPARRAAAAGHHQGPGLGSAHPAGRLAGPDRTSGSTSGSTRSSATCRRRSSGPGAPATRTRGGPGGSRRMPSSYYFMGKDNIVFHAEIWPAMLFGYNGKGAKDGRPGALGALNLPSEIVSSEFLTMEGRKFSSSRSVVIYVRDFLARYDVDALRYYVAVAGPETQDTDFTWSEFVRRNNDELRGELGQPGQPHGLVRRTQHWRDPCRRRADRDRPARCLTGPRRRSPPSARCWRAAVSRPPCTEAMRTLAEANKYLSDQAPWKLRESDPDRMRTILHVALQLVDDGKTLLTPFLPRSSQKVFEMLGGTGQLVRHAADRRGRPRMAAPRYPVITGDYLTAARWESAPIRPGTSLGPPTPLFAKLDTSVVDEELARLENK